MSMDLASKHLVLALFGASLAEVDSALQEVLAESGMTAGFQRFTGDLDLRFVSFGSPPRGGAHAKRAVMYQPLAHPGSTVFVANLRDGWQTMVNCLAGRLAGVHVRVNSSDEAEPYPIQTFELWRNGNSQRVVQVLRDTDKWEFFERGPLQSFEHPNSYESRRKRDRLTRTDLVRYMRSVGCDFTNDSFWRSEEPSIFYAGTRPSR